MKSSVALIVVVLVLAQCLLCAARAEPSVADIAHHVEEYVHNGAVESYNYLQEHFEEFKAYVKTLSPASVVQKLKDLVHKLG